MRGEKSRRKSVDSSSSSSDSSDPHDKCKERKGERKERREERKIERQIRKEERRKEKEEKRDKGHNTDTSFPHLAGDAYTHQMTQGGQSHFGAGYRAGEEHAGQPPPPYIPQNPLPPPSGYRVPLTTQTAFPLDARQTGPPAFIDADGVSPIFIGSALLEKSVHPCKIGPHLNPFASVPYGGGEYGHQGRFDLLPFHHDQMEWVRTSNGRIPSGRKPVEGGYEEDGKKLYHAAAVVNGVKVPGKTGEHLVGARVPFGGVEHEIYGDYEILCWRY